MGKKRSGKERPGKKRNGKKPRFQRDMSVPLQDYRYEVGRPDDAERVDAFLSRRISWRSREQIKELITAGRVEAQESTKGNPAAILRPATKVRAGQEIVVWLDGPGLDNKATNGPMDALRPEGTPPKIETLFEDDYLLAVSKPPGMSPYPTRRHRTSSLIEWVHHEHRRLERPGPPPSPCHRLDRETSGLLLYAKDRKTRAEVGRQIEAREVSKSYLAVVNGIPHDHEGTIDLALARDPDSTIRLKQAVVAQGRGQGQAALTRWRVREKLRDCTLVELFPETGRQHQLRVHMAAIGHPILGDKLYFGGDEVFLRSVEGRLTDSDRLQLRHDRQALHAWRLGLVHPVLGTDLLLEAPLWPDLVKLRSPNS